MNWSSQLQLLYSLQGSFPEPNFLELPTHPASESQIRTVLERAELAQREEADAALRTFFQADQWPENLPRPVKYFLRQRIDFALWLTLALVAPGEAGPHGLVPNPPADFDRQTQLEWLLIWAWRGPGLQCWLEKAALLERLARRQP